MGSISKNFSYSEFQNSNIAKAKNIDNTLPEDLKPSVKALVDNVLQPLRILHGKTLTVSSGYRCPELNTEVGGKATSQHLRGEAADIACALKPVELARLAHESNLPYDQMGLYNTFVHFSYNPDGEQRGMVFYSNSYNGEQI